jgi:formate hydrogenlyase subunit 4
MFVKIFQYVLLIIISPFLFGIINRTKAFFAGRKGSPLLQVYYNIFKLLKKHAVYSTTVTPLFKAGPIIGLAALSASLLILPVPGKTALVSFEGDLILFIYLLGLARFFTVLAALDTGSSFEGMGASREVQFAVFAEPALFIGLGILSRVSGTMSLSLIFSLNNHKTYALQNPAVMLTAVSLYFIFLCENSRIPVDDPNTHLELTMVHEAMILDHSGVDLAFIYTSCAVKFLVLSSLITGLFLQGASYGWPLDTLFHVLKLFCLAFITGITESIIARLEMLKVPHFLISALSLVLIALILTLR